MDQSLEMEHVIVKKYMRQIITNCLQNEFVYTNKWEKMFDQMEVNLHTLSKGKYQPSYDYSKENMELFVDTVIMESNHYIDILYVLCKGITNTDDYLLIKRYINIGELIDYIFGLSDSEDETSSSDR